MSKRTLLCAFTVLTILLPCHLASGANWPRFRGPNGTGVADDKNIPIHFDDKSGILWKMPLPGPGNSSPVVWDNHLFLQAATKDGSKRLLLCLDATTGNTLWSREVPGAKAKTHVKNTLASSSPATDGQVVATAFWDGKDVSLYTYDFKGNLLWKQDLGTFTSQHGAGASPIIFQDKVFFANDQDGTATLYAFDKKTGQMLWKKDREAFRACYSAPFLRERPGFAPELIVTSTTSIRSYDPDTGAENWDWKWKFTAKMPLRTTGSPVLANGIIIACSGDGGGDRHMSAVRLNGNGTKTVAKTIWENKKDFPYVPCVLCRGDYVYFVNDRGFAGCFVAKTGKQVWLVRQPETQFTASPVLIDGKIYAPSEQGDVFVFAAEPKYELLAKNNLGELMRASPAVANGRLYIRGQNHLYCIGK